MIRPRRLIALGAGLALALAAARDAAAQSDPRLVGAVRQAQAGEVDSARATLRRLATSTPPTDQLYPEILYSIALTAADVTERERNLQRVTVEYPLSPWADDALLLLAESDYAGGNLPGTARDLEKIRRDYPDSPILSRAAVWAARTYFDMRNQRTACDWVLAGLRRRDADAETHAQLRSQVARCGTLIAASDTISPPADTVAVAKVTAAAPAPTDTAARGAARDTIAVIVPPAPAPTASPASPPAARRFRVQLAAAGTRSDAESIVRGLAGRGIEADVVEDKGYFKVRTGHFASRRDAQLEANRLRTRLGNGAFVVSE